MRPDELFGIDVAAEVATLCRAQLQGSWQVPAEIVRLANARGASRIEVDRNRRSFHIRCDGVLATPDELGDLIDVVNGGTSHRQRQQAVSRMESAGLTALLWVVGLPGSMASVTVRSGGGAAMVNARRGRMNLVTDPTDVGLPGTTVVWRCRGLKHRRAVNWMRTALRFVPIPVLIDGREIDRGFSGGLYRMSIHDPLPGELAVTDTGEAPTLWLLEHGVLSARAVVPDYPAFSAALEMSGRAPAGASADELRAAANPFLSSVIDWVARMLLMLVDRLASVEEPVRARIVASLLRFAVKGVRRGEILKAPMIGVTKGPDTEMASPMDLAVWASRRGGVLPSVEPGSRHDAGRYARVVVAGDEELGLLAELLGVHLERISCDRSLAVGPWIGRTLRRLYGALLGFAGSGPLDRRELTEGERRFIDAATAAGLDLAFCAGDGAARMREAGTVVGRDRAEVRVAAAVVGDDGAWLYPALLAVGGEDIEIPEEIRTGWLEAVAGRNARTPK